MVGCKRVRLYLSWNFGNRVVVTRPTLRYIACNSVNNVARDTNKHGTAGENGNPMSLASRTRSATDGFDRGCIYRQCFL